MRKFFAILVVIVALAPFIRAQNCPELPAWSRAFSRLSASNLYLSYLSIALIGGKAERYEKEKEIADAMISSIETTVRRCKDDIKLIRRESNLDSDDVFLLAQIEEALVLLEKDCEKLKNYLQEKTDESFEEFTDHHERTGDFLEKLFKEK